jgi:outer membrane lipoprotein-sorting protein
VRVTSRMHLAALLLVGIWIATAPRTTVAQDPNSLMPAESAAKAKQLIEAAVQALGGAAYLNVRDVTCTGKLSQFGHSGDLSGYEKFIDYAKPPDKDRTENIPKRNLIQIMNGNKGWVLDRGGVSEALQTDVAHFEEDTKKDIDNILRNRYKEPGMVLRYAGSDVVDLKEVDWIELVDSDNRTIRIAFSRETHMPVRKVVTTRDANIRMKFDETEYYTNYHPLSGVETPFQITRERNGLKTYQVFFDTCDYNTNLSDSLFSKESLDERWQKIAPKNKKKGKD